MAKSIIRITTIAMIAALAFTGCVDFSDVTNGRVDEFLRTLDGEAQDVPVIGITAVYNQGATVVHPSTPLNNLKSGLTVTANYVNGTTRVLPTTAYSLSGALTVGTSEITVIYGELTAAFTVRVTLPDIPAVPLVSISAVYDSSIPFYLSSPLDNLKNGLTVTATYGDGTTRTLGASEYTLWGTDITMERTVIVTHEHLGVARTVMLTVTVSVREAVASLYAKTPPVSLSDVAVNLSFVSGGNVFDRAFNYMNANPGEYTLVLESDVEIVGGFENYVAELNQSGTKLTIIGQGAERVIVTSAQSLSINLGAAGSSVARDIELTLGDNVTLRGNVGVNTGTFAMEGSAKVIPIFASALSSSNVNADGGDIIMRDNAKIECGAYGNVNIRGGSFTMYGNASVVGGSGVRVGNHGTFVMEGNSSVSGSTGSASGDNVISAVSVRCNNCSFTMIDNASVYGNTGASGAPGGVYLWYDNYQDDAGPNRPIFAMRDNASVHGNTGHGVEVRNGQFIMEGGASVHGNSEAGVYLRRHTNPAPIPPVVSFVMGGSASVYGNGGGGVHVDGASFTMGGVAAVYGNTIGGNGGGVSVSGVSGRFIMENGALIYGNSATGASGSGGGVYVSGGAFTMSGGTIYGLDAPSETFKNTAGRRGAALFVDSGMAQYGDEAVIAGAGTGVDLTIDGRQ